MSVESSPEFKAALNKASEGAYNKFLFGSKRKVKAVEELSPSVAKILKEVAYMKKAAERLKREANQTRIRIHNSGIVCPVCGEGDQGNTMNGEPWCFKCNRALEDAGRKKGFKIKVLPKGYLPNILRGLPDEEMLR